MIAIIGFRYQKYTHYTLHGSCLPIYEIAITISLSFLFLAHYHKNANICVAIKSGSIVLQLSPKMVQASHFTSYNSDTKL